MPSNLFFLSLHQCVPLHTKWLESPLPAEASLHDCYYRLHRDYWVTPAPKGFGWLDLCYMKMTSHTSCLFIVSSADLAVVALNSWLNVEPLVLALTHPIAPQPLAGFPPNSRHCRPRTQPCDCYLWGTFHKEVYRALFIHQTWHPKQKPSLIPCSS